MRPECKDRFGNSSVWMIAIVLVVIAIGATVFHNQRKRFAQRTHCVGNLVHLKLAKQQCKVELKLTDGDSIPFVELEQRLSKPFKAHTCPNGGTYIVGVVGVSPQCTYTNVSHTYAFDHLRPIHRRWYHSLTLRDYHFPD